MSFDTMKIITQMRAEESQSLWNRAMSFDFERENQPKKVPDMSQSLWNRAMSFDK